jgi:hypothetical protein
VHGLPGSAIHGIWIKETSELLKKSASLHEVIAHECGHWWHKHTLFGGEITSEQIEWEADKFAFERLSPEERTALVEHYPPVPLLLLSPIGKAIPSLMQPIRSQIRRSFGREYYHASKKHYNNFMKFCEQHPDKLSA